MAEPRIIPREEHTLSRRDIDPDALKVLYRLRQADHVAFLVGGSVRDLLLGRRPKDFDIGTSAHPYQVKKLFRNCWIIGRRFRLAHVKFGTKVIEVATFRRQLAPGEEVVQDGVPAPDPSTVEGQHLIHHDNTFGTPEEDALRRDFTINALAYDISNFSVIDYVGGLEDLRAGIVRSIGDPDVRLREDPVRMLRAIAIAARLDFTIEPSLLEAIRTHRHEIA
jgi:poly(A) polymerase